MTIERNIKFSPNSMQCLQYRRALSLMQFIYQSWGINNWPCNIKYKNTHLICWDMNPSWVDKSSLQNCTSHLASYSCVVQVFKQNFGFGPFLDHNTCKSGIHDQRVCVGVEGGGPGREGAGREGRGACYILDHDLDVIYSVCIPPLLALA